MEALKTLRTITDEGKLHELGEWINSCRHLPTFARPGQALRSWIIFATEGYITYKWKKQEAGAAYPPCAPLEEAMGTQALITCGAQVPQGRELRAGTWKRSSARPFFTRQRHRKRKGKSPNRLSHRWTQPAEPPLTQRLLKRRRIRRQSAPKHSRSERELRGFVSFYHLCFAFL